jgi:hypothetical protein
VDLVHKQLQEDHELLLFEVVRLRKRVHAMYKPGGLRGEDFPARPPSVPIPVAPQPQMQVLLPTTHHALLMPCLRQDCVVAWAPDGFQGGPSSLEPAIRTWQPSAPVVLSTPLYPGPP